MQVAKTTLASKGVQFGILALLIAVDVACFGLALSSEFPSLDATSFVIFLAVSSASLFGHAFGACAVEQDGRVVLLLFAGVEVLLGLATDVLVALWYYGSKHRAGSFLNPETVLWVVGIDNIPRGCAVALALVAAWRKRATPPTSASELPPVPAYQTAAFIPVTDVSSK